jgi:hypothetical protein
MVSTVYYIIGSLIFIKLTMAILRVWMFLKEKKSSIQQRLLRIKPLLEKLKRGQTPDALDIKNYASNKLTRQLAFLVLKEHNKSHLFPQDYYSTEHFAESNLATWLEFPTELEKCPDQLEYLEKVSFQHNGKNMHYHVFKFRVREPHWAAKQGWMVGVVGPYHEHSRPHDWPYATFSRFKKLQEKTAKEEAEWVHYNITPKKQITRPPFKNPIL